VAKAESTPFWMRHYFGDLPVEYRVGIGVFVLILIISAILAAISGEKGTQLLLTQLLDMLKAVLGGIAGGALVRRLGPH
jgi:hypothetical protein